MASIYKNNKGKWVAQLEIGLYDNGLRKYKTFQGDSKEEVQERLNKYLNSAEFNPIKLPRNEVVGIKKETEYEVQDISELKSGHFVYCYTHKDYGSIYIGRTENLVQRIYSHDSKQNDNIDRRYVKMLRESVVNYINLGSKEQTIVVEGYLIDKYKPLLNKASKSDIQSSIDMSIKEKWKRYYRDFELKKEKKL